MHDNNEASRLSAEEDILKMPTSQQCGKMLKINIELHQSCISIIGCLNSATYSSMKITLTVASKA